MLERGERKIRRVLTMDEVIDEILRRVLDKHHLANVKSKEEVYVVSSRELRELINAPFPSFGFGIPLHLVQLPTPSGYRPHARGVIAHGPRGRDFTTHLHWIPLWWAVQESSLF